MTKRKVLQYLVSQISIELSIKKAFCYCHY